MTRQLIVSADDFGASPQINSAVARGFREGILTSAGLMVGGKAALGAVELAKNEPGLAVGLHLALSDSRSILPHDTIPNVVDEAGRFANNPAAAGLRYFMSKHTQRQLRLEIEAQFEAFLGTGLELSHVDGHQHLHAHPCVLPVVVRQAIKNGAKGIRIPCEPLWANLAANPRRPIYKLLIRITHGYLASVGHRLVAQSGLATCEVVVGSMMSGSMGSDYVMRILQRLPHRRVELYFHPSTSKNAAKYGPNLEDLKTLADPDLRSFISQRYELTTYSGLSREGIGDLA